MHYLNALLPEPEKKYVEFDAAASSSALWSSLSKLQQDLEKKALLGKDIAQLCRKIHSHLTLQYEIEVRKHSEDSTPHNGDVIVLPLDEHEAGNRQIFNVYVRI
jgi:hypothetical protein